MVIPSAMSAGSGAGPCARTGLEASTASAIDATNATTRGARQNLKDCPHGFMCIARTFPT
jgi:hypothetical protein